MAKFCTKCGKPLEEGHVCDCEKENKNSENENFGNTLLDIFKNILIKPVDVLKKYTKEVDIKIILALVAIAVVAGGIFSYGFINNSVKGIANEVNSKVQGMSLVSSLTGSDSADITGIGSVPELPFDQLFKVGAIFTVLQYLSFALMGALFVGVIFKGKMKFAEFFQLHAIPLASYSIMMLLSFILSYLSYKIALVVMVFGALFYFIHVIQGYIEIAKAKEDRLMYSVPLMLVTGCVVFILLVQLVNEII